jgi:hypothetical protein
MSQLRRSGAPGGIRTPDARLRTAALYPLSYGGAVSPSYLRRSPETFETSEPMPTSPRVVLYERQGCHLCEEVRVLLDEMLGPRAYQRVDIDRDDELVLRYGFRVPVVSVDGEDRLEPPTTPDEVRSLVRSLAKADR